jgi:hypothetical protein
VGDNVLGHTISVLHVEDLIPVIDATPFSYLLEKYTELPFLKVILWV